ncbi:MAG: activase [Desulfobacterales bacterium]|nr:activase [Desulfobacterales bacterium]
MLSEKFYGGCDIGFISGKAVVLTDKGIAATAIVDNEILPEETAYKAFKEAFAKIPSVKEIEALSFSVATGFGRKKISFANKNVSDITCNSIGLYYSTPEIKTVIDIGGESIKAILLGNNGNVLDFVVNDRCSSGTGRFFENIARIFKTDIDSFCNLSIDTKKSFEITSQCSVLAETEAITLLAQGKPPAEIALGIQKSVAKRCYVLLNKVGIQPKIGAIGGCAKNIGLIKEIERLLNYEIIKPTIDSQLIAALGAAILARKMA